MKRPAPPAAAAALARLRIDKWLWAARFFKTRSLASEAIARNQIQIGGQRVKPSRTVVVGETVVVEKPPFRFEVQVLGITEQRRPASEAQALYAETAESVAARAVLADRLRAERTARPGLNGLGRPNKKQRRQIIRFQTRKQPSVPDD